MCASPAIAAHVEPTAEPLWNAFPLNPAGKRLVKTGEHHFVPPTTDALEAFVPDSDRDGRFVVSRARLLVLVCAALIALCVLGLFRLRLRRSRWSNANGDRSGDLLAFSMISSMVAAEVLWGYAVYTVLVLLL